MKKQIVLYFVAMFLGIAITTAQNIEGSITYKASTVIPKGVEKEVRSLFE